MQSSLPDRGQIGISTLILFIVGLLIVTATAGVVMQTTGLLEARTTGVNRGVDQQMTQHVDVVAVTGRVRRTDGTLSVTGVRLIVKADADALPLDFGDAVVHLQTPAQSTSLTYSGSTTATQGQTFGVVGLRDAHGSVPVLTEPSDRFALVVATPSLSPNARVEIKLGLPAGTTQSITAVVPGSLEREGRTELR